MKTHGKFVVALGLVLLLAIFASAESKARKVLYPMTYNVSDLPVWRTNGKETEFAPQVLIKYLQTTVDPQSWKSGAELKADERRASLIISQTQANHGAIADALAEFRTQDVREAIERIKD